MKAIADRQLESDIEEIRRSMRDPDLMDAFIGLVRAGKIVNTGQRRDGKILWAHKDALSGEPQQPALASAVPATPERDAERSIASDEKWVFEVKGGVLLCFGERTELEDGWWFSTNSNSVGPFATDQAALEAAEAAPTPPPSSTLLTSPDPPLPVTDPGEVFPLAKPPSNTLTENAMMTTIMTLVFADARHVPDLVAELHAAGYSTDICPDELKPDFDVSCEYIEVSLATDVPHEDREGINKVCGVMLGEVTAICERHGAFCDGCEELPWRAVDAAEPHKLN